MFIPETDLIDRRLYRIRSRNLMIGVWDPRRRGFIGLREKFGERYPFLEFHSNQGPPLGTAQAERDLGIDVPVEIELDEYGPKVEREGRTYFTYNQPLLALLEEHEPAVLAEIRAEHEQAAIEAESLRWKPKTEAEVRYEEAREATRAWQKEQSAAGRNFRDYIDEYHARMKADRKILEEEA